MRSVGGHRTIKELPTKKHRFSLVGVITLNRQDVSHSTALLREQADARDEISQRLFGLGMSLRSVISTIDATEPARRIAAVVDGMSDVVETLGYESRGDSARPPDHES